jgi:hypothetical protein
LKAKLYARHAIREFWVINAATRVTWVHTQPNPDGSWGSLEETAADAALTVSVAPGLTIRTVNLDERPVYSAATGLCA